MDHYPFEINLKIIGCDIDDFIDILNKNGFNNQAKEVEKQFDIQLTEFSEGNQEEKSKSNCNIPHVSGSLACPNCGAELQLEVKEITNSDILKALKANDC